MGKKKTSVTNTAPNIQVKNNAELPLWLANEDDHKAMMKIAISSKLLPLSTPELNALKELSICSGILMKDLLDSYLSDNSLDLDGDKIESLPDSIGSLIRLKSLSISNNRLSILPDSIGNLTNLANLSTDGNNLTSLPDSIGRLVNLQSLYLSHNLLTAIPATIGDITNLERLSLNFNKIKTLPESLSKLQYLKKFYLSNNKLSSIPASVEVWLKNMREKGCVFFGLDFIEPTPPTPKIVVEREVVVVKVRCPFCKFLASTTDSVCPNCGGIL
jgi:hypothetical protein